MPVPAQFYTNPASNPPNPAYHHPVYQHPPSPSPSTQSYSNQSTNRTPPVHPQPQYNYSQPCQRLEYCTQPNCGQQACLVPQYQRVPSREDQLAAQNANSLYQRLPSNDYNCQYPRNGAEYPHQNSLYQRVPDPNYTAYQAAKYSPYQQALPPKQVLKKTVSFEPGTKGGAESPTPKAVITPIIVNNSNGGPISAKSKCNLCRKKHVVAPNLYCTDCEFYMSRFKPKT